MTTAIKAFSTRSNAVRAAKAALGTTATGFTVEANPEGTGFVWKALEAPKPPMASLLFHSVKPEGINEDDDEPKPTPVKRPYAGKYPDRISGISTQKGVAHIYTNGGKRYTLAAQANGHKLPNLGDDISTLNVVEYSEPQPEPAVVVEPVLNTAEVMNMPTKLYEKKSEAVTAARKTLGGDAELTKDFLIKRTARGEWYWMRAEQPKAVAPKAKADKAPKPAKAERIKTPKADKAAGEKRPMGESMTKLISMLSRANGASVEEITAVIPWEAHTTRARISADLVNKRGYKIERTKNEKRGSVYKIVGEPAAKAA